MNSFAFEAQNPEGTPIEGSLNADSAQAAQQMLESLGLRVMSVRPMATSSRPAQLSAGDLQLFNEQLEQLASAGLPIEKGLQLLARDMQSSRLKSTMQALADDLAGGKNVEEAIAARRGQFPQIYSQLIDAGVRTSNLPGVLHSFGRYLETVERIKSELWRACAYPMVVLVAFCLLMIFLSYCVLPLYYEVISSTKYTSFNWTNFTRTDHAIEIPTGSLLLFHFGRAMPLLLGALIIAITLIFITWVILKRLGKEGAWVDRVVLRIPLVGRALHHNYVARWTDALAIGVRSGMDLPQAVGLAGQVVAVPSIKQDSTDIIETLQSGHALDRLVELQRLPSTIPAAIQIASRNGNLPAVLEQMARQFERQTDERIRLIPATLLPILVILIGVCAAGVIYGLWAPLANLLKWMTGVS